MTARFCSGIFIHLNIFIRQMTIIAIIALIAMIGKPHGWVAKGMCAPDRFMPYAEKIIVGIAMTSVIIASAFMATLR